MQGEVATVPYIVYEGEQARTERHVKRLIAALILAVILLFASNLAWLYAWIQYDYIGSEAVSTVNDVLIKEAQGPISYIGRDGNINPNQEQDHAGTDSRAS